MKKFIAMLLCILIAAMCVPCSAEVAEKSVFQKTAEEFTFFHYAFFEEFTEYEFGDNYPLLELTGHSYGNVAAYSTESRLYDVVFLPDETGDNIWAIHIIAYRSDVVDYAEFETGFMHVLGLLYPFIIEMSADGGADAFSEEVMKAMATVSVKPQGTEFYHAPVNYAGMADVEVYVNADTFGIGIYFPEPVSWEELDSRAYIWMATIE